MKLNLSLNDDLCGGEDALCRLLDSMPGPHTTCYIRETGLDKEMLQQRKPHVTFLSGVYKTSFRIMWFYFIQWIC